MVRNYKSKNKTKKWTQAALEQAIAERLELNTSIRDLSKKYGVTKSSLHNHIKEIGSKKVGKKRVFTYEEEEELRKCIVDMADLGFAITLQEIGDVVESYVMHNDIDKGKVTTNIGVYYSSKRIKGETCMSILFQLLIL